MSLPSMQIQMLMRYVLLLIFSLSLCLVAAGQSDFHNRISGRYWCADKSEAERELAVKDSSIVLRYEPDIKKIIGTSRWGLRFEPNGTYRELGTDCGTGRKPETGTWTLSGDTVMIQLNNQAMIRYIKVLWISDKEVKFKTWLVKS